MSDKHTEWGLRAAGYFWAVRDGGEVYTQRYIVTRFGPGDAGRGEEYKIVSPHYRSRGAAVRFANTLNKSLP